MPFLWLKDEFLNECSTTTCKYASIYSFKFISKKMGKSRVQNSRVQFHTHTHAYTHILQLNQLFLPFRFQTTKGFQILQKESPKRINDFTLKSYIFCHSLTDFKKLSHINMKSSYTKQNRCCFKTLKHILKQLWICFYSKEWDRRLQNEISPDA